MKNRANDRLLFGRPVVTYGPIESGALHLFDAGQVFGFVRWRRWIWHAFGKVRAKRALRAIDVLSDRHVLHEIAPAFWRHVHLCVERNVVPDAYDEAAFRLRTSAGLS
ncbi:MAG: hypothetical protein AAGJ32_09470 [Pseudomonadota bacterium]